MHLDSPLSSRSIARGHAHKLKVSCLQRQLHKGSGYHDGQQHLLHSAAAQDALTAVDVKRKNFYIFICTCSMFCDLLSSIVYYICHITFYV